MKFVTSLLAEIQEQEASDLISPQQLRLVLLKTMNYLLSTYDNKESAHAVTSSVDELQRLYNYLQQSKVVTREQLNEIRNDIYSCMNRISKELAEIQPPDVSV